MKAIRKLRPDHWAIIHAKIAMLVWAILFLAYTPLTLSKVLQGILPFLISGAVLFGVTISLVGIFMSISKFACTARRGENLELAGLWLSLSGPLAYFAIQVYLSFLLRDGEQRIALSAFAYAFSSFMFVRIVIIHSHRKRINA